MAYTREIRNKAYFKRFQVKPRRRRQGKTDYQARRALVVNDKNKYNSPKYRLVVRFTKSNVVTQIVYARLDGDHVMAAAHSHELPRYGVPVGLTNYAAAYATGLLLARRLLTQLNMADTYVGKEEADGELFEVEAEGDARPFRALLDVGLVRTTTGHRVFGAMKGAVDGGLDIPHNEKRFPAYSKDGGFDPEALKARIYGTHVSEYMAQLKEDDPGKYQKLFSQYVKAGIEPDALEDMYREAHKKIRASPQAVPTDKSGVVTKKRKSRKLTLAQRKQRVAEKIQRMVAEAAEEGQEDNDDDDDENEEEGGE